VGNPLLKPGTVIDGYEVVSLLGKGGMGAVYRVHRGGAVFALKTLSGGDLAAPDQVVRFRREGEVLLALDHPSIVRVHASGQAQGLLYLIMSLVDGESLEARIRRAGPLAVADAGALLLGVARAIAFAHARGVVHRDLKPANILIENGTGRPFVVDFGLARQLGDTAERLTRTGEVMGTPAYVAPEQAFGLKQEQDERTDVYGLGALLYGALAGRAPFVGTSAIAVLKQVSMDEPRPLEKVPPAIDAVVRRAMVKERDQRTPSAAAFADELEAALGGGEGGGLPRYVLALVLLALASVLAVTGLVLWKTRPWDKKAAGNDAGPVTSGSAEVSPAAIAELVASASVAAERGDSAGALKILARVRPYHDLAIASALDLGRKLHANREWSRLAAASEIFLSLEPPPEEKILLEDWKLAADLALFPGRDLEKLKAHCQGRADLERSPLGPPIKAFYEKALASAPPAAALLALYPLPPSPEQREKVGAACLGAAKELNDATPVSDLPRGLVKLGAILDRLQCAHAADAKIPSLPDEVFASLYNTLVTGSIAGKQLPVDWEKAFMGDPGRPGFPDHPIELYFRARVHMGAGDFDDAVVDVRQAREAIGAQRTRLARRLADMFTTDIFGELRAPQLPPIYTSFAEVADNKRTWARVADLRRLHGDLAGEKEARERAERAQDLPD
jgi:hypothetical protein